MGAVTRSKITVVIYIVSCFCLFALEIFPHAQQMQLHFQAI